jgi:hypothetical protein
MQNPQLNTAAPFTACVFLSHSRGGVLIAYNREKGYAQGETSPRITHSAVENLVFMG